MSWIRTIPAALAGYDIGHGLYVTGLLITWAVVELAALAYWKRWL